MEMKRFGDKDWKRMAQWLKDSGYTAAPRPKEIQLVTFTHPTRDPVYLYRPDLKGCEVQYTDEVKPASIQAGGEDTVYLPTYCQGIRDRYLWAVRTLKDKPSPLFTLPDAASHLGVSVAWLKTEIYRLKRIAIHPARNMIGGIVVFTEQELLNWDRQRNPIGAPKQKEPLPEMAFAA